MRLSLKMMKWTRSGSQRKSFQENQFPSAFLENDKTEESVPISQVTRASITPLSKPLSPSHYHPQPPKARTSKAPLSPVLLCPSPSDVKAPIAKAAAASLSAAPRATATQGTNPFLAPKSWLGLPIRMGRRKSEAPRLIDRRAEKEAFASLAPSSMASVAPSTVSITPSSKALWDKARSF